MNASGVGRRDFLKTTLATSLMLGTGAGLATLSGCSDDRPATGYLHLRASDVAFLTPLVPVILTGGSLPKGDEDIPKVLASLDQLLDMLSPEGRKSLGQLYDMLQLGAFRWWMSGVWSHPEKLSLEEREQMLLQWSVKDSTLGRISFGGVTRPLLVSWYGRTDIAMTTGYPGPPKKVVS